MSTPPPCLLVGFSNVDHALTTLGQDHNLAHAVAVTIEDVRRSFVADRGVERGRATWVVRAPGIIAPGSWPPEVEACASQAMNLGIELYVMADDAACLPPRMIPCIGQVVCAPHLCSPIVPMARCGDALLLDYGTMTFRIM